MLGRALEKHAQPNTKSRLTRQQVLQSFHRLENLRAEITSLEARRAHVLRHLAELRSFEVAYPALLAEAEASVAQLPQRGAQ
eukprot:4666783-Pleurochrysis_carterae.AAC.2